MKAFFISSMVCLFTLTGCVQSYEAGERDVGAYNYTDDEPQASSLIEVTFGDGDPPRLVGPAVESSSIPARLGPPPERVVA